MLFPKGRKKKKAFFSLAKIEALRMPRPGPRPYECVKRAWHSDRHQPIRGFLIKEIFRFSLYSPTLLYTLIYIFIYFCVFCMHTSGFDVKLCVCLSLILFCFDLGLLTRFIARLLRRTKSGKRSSLLLC